MSADVTKLKTEIRDLEGRAKEARDEWHMASNKLANFNDIVKSLERKKEDEQKQLGWVKELSEGLLERSESDEWLQSEVDEFEQRVIVHKKQRDEYVKQHEEISHVLEQSREKLRRKENEAGRYEEQKRNHEQQLRDRKTLVKEGARSHSIRGFDGDLDDIQINEYLERITILLKDQQAAVEKVRLETEREMQKAQKVISDLGERRSAINENKSSTRQQVTTNDDRIATSQADLNKIDIDEGGKAVLEDNIEDLEGRLQRAKADAKEAIWEMKIKDNNVQLSALDEESKQLNRDLVQASRQAGDLASLNVRKQNLKESQRSLEKMRVVHNDRLQALVEQQWQPSNLEHAYQRVLQRKADELQDAESVRDREIRCLEQVEYKLNSTRADLNRDQADLEKCTKVIRENVESEPEEYEAAMADLQEGRDTRKADVDGFGHQQDFYEKAFKKAQRDNHCNLCLRGFNRGEEREAFLKRIENIISKQSLKAVQDELKELEELLRRGKEAGPSHDMWVRLSKTELPRLQKHKKSLEKEREEILEKIEGFQRTADKHGEAKKDLDSLAKPVASIVKYSEEVAKFTAQVQELSAKHEDAALSCTADDMQGQLEAVNSKAQAIRKVIEKLIDDKGRANSTISSLELDLSKARNNLAVATYQLDKKSDVSRQVEELRRANQLHRETIQEIDEQLGELASQIDEEIARRDNARQRGLEKESSLQSEANKLSVSVSKLKLVEHNIQTYAEEGGAEKLARSQREIETAQQEIQQNLGEQKQVTVKVNKISEELRNQDETKRTIEYNIKYRKGLRDLEALRIEIANLSEQNAEADQHHWTKQSNRWQAKFNALSTEMTSKLGAARAKDDALNKNIADWETEFKTAAQDYKQAHIEVEVGV